MGFWRTTFRNLAASLLLLGAAAVLLAFAAGTDGPIVLRLLIQFPLLMLFAAIVLFLINLVAAFVGMVVTNSLWAAYSSLRCSAGWRSVRHPKSLGGSDITRCLNRRSPAQAACRGLSHGSSRPTCCRTGLAGVLEAGQASRLHFCNVSSGLSFSTM
jgi:hypothetical protein